LSQHKSATPALIPVKRRRKRKLWVSDKEVCFRKQKTFCFSFDDVVVDVIRALEPLVNYILYDSSLAKRFRNPGAVRSLILLLYAKATKQPVYKVAIKYDTAPEQLYRIERAIREEGFEKLISDAISELLFKK